MSHWLGRAVVVASLLLPRTAAAAPITWQLKGDVTNSPTGNPLEGFLPDGADVNFLLTLDPAAPDLCDAVGAGLYQLPAGSLSFAGGSFAASSIYLEADNPDGSCVPTPSGATIRMFFDMAPFSAAILGWSRGGEALPVVPPDSGYFWIAYAYPADAVFGTVSSAGSDPVAPEPSTWLLMLPALSAIVARRRWRR